MNYEFHVGDYVETNYGFVGWISYMSDDGTCIRAIDRHGNILTCNRPEKSGYVTRIGTYDFTEHEISR